MRATFFVALLLGCSVVLLSQPASSLDTCASLGLGAETVTFEGNINGTSFVYVNGSTAGSKIGFGLSSTGIVYRTADGGASFTEVNPLLTNVNVPSDVERRGAVFDAGVKAMYTDASESILYLFGVDGRIWVSNNGGSNFTYYQLQYTGAATIHWRGYFPHPTVSGTFALVYDTSCCYSGNTCTDCHRGLLTTTADFTAPSVKWHSHNLAYDWFMFIDNGRGTVWLTSDPTALWYLDYPESAADVDVRAFYASIYPSPGRIDADKLPILHFGSTVALPRTGVHFVDAMYYNAGKFVFYGFYGNGVSGLYGDYAVMTSFDQGSTFQLATFVGAPGAPPGIRSYNGWPFFYQEVLFWVFDCSPYCRLAELDYIWDVWAADNATSGIFHWVAPQVAAGVRNGVYVRNIMLPFGTNLTLATCFYDKDLVNLGDEEGVYLFNSYQTREWTDDRIQTRLSFNAGGSYNWISAPITHSYECGLPEGPTCRLHLLGPAEGAQIYSKKFQPAFIIANGAVGTSVDLSDLPEINTFMSKDGGVSWTQINDLANDADEGRHLFEVAAGGSLIAFVNEGTATNVLTFSVDGGSSFTSCTFGSNGDTFYPVSLFGDPDGFTPNLILSARAKEDIMVRDAPSHIFHFNFSSKFNRTCTESDYTTVTRLGHGGQCILGQKKTYKVKKTDAGCFGAFESGTEISNEICNCTIADYGCRECFYYSEFSNTCEWAGQCRDPALAPPSGCYFPETYVVNTSGFRKLANTQCVGGNEDFAIGTRTVTCPVTTDNSNSSGPSAFVIVVIICVSVAGLMVLIFLGALAFRCYSGSQQQQQAQLNQPDPDNEADDVVL